MEISIKEILALKTDDGETIRNYFLSLLQTLWEQGEGFSGKRPFGNSGWEYDIYIPLAKAGLIDSQFDENGYLLELNKKQGHVLVSRLINFL